MSETWDCRTRFLMGDAACDALREASVAVVGIGGVGAYCVEALARAGVGHLFLVDGDVLATSNLNRHILGVAADVGRPKVELAAQRIRSFNPSAVVEVRHEFVTVTTGREFFPQRLDFLVDACDITSVKVHLAELCISSGVPFIMAMGCARRMDPTKVTVTTLDLTSGDPLAALMRKSLRKSASVGQANLDKCAVVMSTEQPIPVPDACKRTEGRTVLPSFVLVPAAAGLAAAHRVIQHIISHVRPVDPPATASPAATPSSSAATDAPSISADAGTPPDPKKSRQ